MGDEKITKDMPITKIVGMYPETIAVFSKYGLHCIGCVAAQFESLAEGAAAHGIDVDKMVEDLNKTISRD